MAEVDMRGDSPVYGNSKSASREEMTRALQDAERKLESVLNPAMQAAKNQLTNEQALVALTSGKSKSQQPENSTLKTPSNS